MSDRTRKSRRVPSLVVVAFVALNVIAPAAWAQVSTDLSTDIPELTDPVGTVTDTVDNTTGTVDKTTQPVQDTVDNTTGTVDTTTGGAVGGTTDTVNDTTDSVTDTGEDTIDQTQKTVDDTTKSTGETATSTTDTVTGAASGGGVTNPDLTVKNPLEDLNGDGKISEKERTLQTPGAKSGRGVVRGERGDSFGNRLGHNGQTRDKRLFNLEKKSRLAAAGGSMDAVVPPEQETFLTQLTEAAVEATKKLAFPLGLALMVGTFLMVQGRIDRKDAKLALAPIDSEQDLLSFQ